MISGFLRIVLMAIIQGVTEFLPVSSSGHLVLAGRLLGLDEQGAGLEIALHFGTLLSIITFYRKDLLSLIKGFDSFRSKSAKTAGLLIIASIPAAVIGLLFEEKLVSLFDSTVIASTMLIVTAIILASTVFARYKTREIGVMRAIVIGLAQVLAIIPGISRSGSTIAIARHAGVEGKKAAQFSFFMAIPAIAGATILEFAKNASDLQMEYIVGVAVAFAVGYFSLSVLVKILNSGKFWIFAPYCAILGIIGLIFL